MISENTKLDKLSYAYIRSNCDIFQIKKVEFVPYISFVFNSSILLQFRTNCLCHWINPFYVYNSTIFKIKIFPFKD